MRPLLHRVSVHATGEQEARAAGQALKKNGLEFDVAYTSVLTRAVKTLNIALEEVNQVRALGVHACC